MGIEPGHLARLPADHAEQVGALLVGPPRSPVARRALGLEAHGASRRIAVVRTGAMIAAGARARIVSRPPSRAGTDRGAAQGRSVAQGIVSTFFYVLWSPSTQDRLCFPYP